MPYTNMRRVKEVHVYEWEVQGEFHIDCYYSSFANFVLVEDDTGGRWLYDCPFVDDSEAAAKFAERVEAAGFIDVQVTVLLPDNIFRGAYAV